jgi:serine/threonine-protein kinase
VVDFGVWEGAPYLVMEYVGGTTLRAVLDEGPMAPQRALLLARQIAAGLAHAHAQGIVHRDVKPANIMISEEVGTGDHVRILDFGLARLRGNIASDQTQTNVVVGTPNYMAPEQTIGGGTIDARTDVYAVGVVLFEMIAGERPFSSEDTLQLLGMHRAAPIPKVTDRIDRSIVLPDGVQAIIDKAMAKLPADRYQSAIELADAIDAIIGPRISAEQKVVSPRRERVTGLAPVAPSLAGSDTADGDQPAMIPAPTGKRMPLAGNLFVLLLVLGGAALALWYIKIRPTSRAVQTTLNGSAAKGGAGKSSAGKGSAGKAVGGKGSAGKGSASALAVTPDAAVAPLVIDAQVPATGPGSGEGSALVAIGPGSGASAASAGASNPVEISAGSGAGSAETVGPGSAAGSGSAAEDIEMDPDPLAATNPDPTADKNEAEDEAADAPVTPEEVEKRLPSAPVRASTVREAVQMLKDGKRDLALASLNALWKKNRKSAYIPFLLGNIYNDRMWWSVAMDHYKIAISKNRAYRGNAVLNRNVIKMLASAKTARKATYFIKSSIGRPAKPYLRYAAKHAKNPKVRKRAGALARRIR